jgi:hypothetical protein
MAYFANGSEGAILDNQCDECIHGISEEMCPVAFVQMNYNYTQKGDLTKCLNYLIDEHGICQMKRAIDASKILHQAATDTRDKSDLEIWEEQRRQHDAR